MSKPITPSYDGIRLILIVSFLLVLEWICRMGWLQSQVMVPPSVMVVSLWKLLHSEIMLADIVITLGAAVQALVISILVGVVLGWLMNRLPRLGEILYPVLSSW